MSRPGLKRRWKLFVNLVTVAALLILIYAIRQQLADTFNNLFRVNAWALLLIIPIEILNYHARPGFTSAVQDCRQSAGL